MAWSRDQGTVALERWEAPKTPGRFLTGRVPIEVGNRRVLPPHFSPRGRSIERRIRVRLFVIRRHRQEQDGKVIVDAEAGSGRRKVRKGRRHLVPARADRVLAVKGRVDVVAVGVAVLVVAEKQGQAVEPDLEPRSSWKTRPALKGRSPSRSRCRCRS